ncbi:MAG: DNA repair protein RadC [Candidatus Brocadiia bacterium]
MATYKKPATKSFTMHDTPPSERPRERLRALGADKLSAPELLAIILRSGKKGEPVTMLAQRLLGEFKNIQGLADAPVEELSRVSGIGPAKAAEIKAAMELGRRLISFEAPNKTDIIANPARIIDFLYPELYDKKQEYFYIVTIDSRNQIINKENISKGSLNASIVEPREVFSLAIKSNAAAVIFAHNHPSGDPTPSAEDINITRKLVAGGKLLNIEVLDHIIITRNRNKCLSFKEEKLI